METPLEGPAGAHEAPPPSAGRAGEGLFHAGAAARRMRLSVLLLASLLALAFVPAAAADPVEGDVFLPPLTGCTWSGSYKPVAEAGPVTVWAWSCDPET